MFELISAVFDSRSYADNILAWFPRVAAFIILALGGYVFWRERASRIGIQYLLFDISVFIYLIGMSFQLVSINQNIGLIWGRFTQIGVFLMYPTIYQFGVLFIGYERKKRNPVRVAWIFSGIFILINIFTDWYISDLYQYWWGGYVKFGYLPAIYLTLSSFFVVTGLAYILQVFRQTEVGTIRHQRAKGLLWAFGFGMVAFVDTVAAFGYDLYPFGYVGLVIHAIFVATLTWRYKLVGITPEFAAKEIVSTMSDALLVLDSEKIIRLANAEAARLFNCAEADLLNQPVSEALPSSELSQYIYDLTQGDSVKNSEVRIMNASGEFRIMNVSVSVIRERDQALAYTCVLRDVTEQRRIQGELERRVTKRTAELAVVRDQALAASRTKSAFLTNMSHELRTPLNAIIGYSEMLYEDAAKISEPQARDDLQKISTAGNHLLELINTVLDLSKIEAGKMELLIEEFRIEGVVREIVDAFKPLAKHNGNELSVVLPADIGTMFADRTKVKQILMNIVGNACKFTNDGKIVIEVERSISGGAEWVCFSVTDNGIGISPKEQESLFSEFTQASISIPKIYGGTGLGLSISQKLCQLMGGAITVESEADIGTEFTICLPTAVQQTENIRHEKESVE